MHMILGNDLGVRLLEHVQNIERIRYIMFDNMLLSFKLPSSNVRNNRDFAHTHRVSDSKLQNFH